MHKNNFSYAYYSRWSWSIICNFLSHPVHASESLPQPHCISFCIFSMFIVSDHHVTLLLFNCHTYLFTPASQFGPVQDEPGLILCWFCADPGLCFLSYPVLGHGGRSRSKTIPRSSCKVCLGENKWRHWGWYQSAAKLPCIYFSLVSGLPQPHVIPSLYYSIFLSN